MELDLHTENPWQFVDFIHIQKNKPLLSFLVLSVLVQHYYYEKLIKEMFYSEHGVHENKALCTFFKSALLAPGQSLLQIPVPNDCLAELKAFFSCILSREQLLNSLSVASTSATGKVNSIIQLLPKGKAFQKDFVAGERTQVQQHHHAACGAVCWRHERQ